MHRAPQRPVFHQGRLRLGAVGPAADAQGVEGLGQELGLQAAEPPRHLGQRTRSGQILPGQLTLLQFLTGHSVSSGPW